MFSDKTTLPFLRVSTILSLGVILLGCSRQLCAQQDIYPQIKNGVTVGLDLSKRLDDILGPTQSAFDTVMDSYTKLAEAVVGNQHPSKPEHPYSIDGFAFKVNEAASKLAATNVDPPSVDAGQYSVSLDQLRECSNQRVAFGSLDGYAAAMDRAAAEGQSTIRALNARLDAVKRFEDGAHKFAEIALRAADTPSFDWDAYFASTWWDLDQHLNPALANLRNVLNRQIKSVSKNVTALQGQSGRLRDNVRLLKPGECSLSGTWSGNCFLMGWENMPTTMTLTSGTSDSGVFTEHMKRIRPDLDDIVARIYNAKISNYVNFTADGDSHKSIYSPFSISGTFNQQYESVTLVLKNKLLNGTPGTCNLKK